MRDYSLGLSREDGTELDHTPVSNISTSDLRHCLECAVEGRFTMSGRNDGASVEDIVERIRIELMIRQMGL